MLAKRKFLTLSIVLILVGVGTFFVLTSGGSSEERADKFFASAQSFLAEGDVDRATLEFRNVFKLNNLHEEARAAFARMFLDDGEPAQALKQYQRLVEQYPENWDGQRAIVEIYSAAGIWPEMKPYLAAILKNDANDAVARPLQVVFDYQEAISDRDVEVAKVAVDAAIAMRAEFPDHILLRQIVVDSLIRKSDFGAALSELNQAINIAPDNRGLYAARLAVYSAQRDGVAIEAQLKEMLVLFPDDENNRASLVRWYVSQNQLDEAEQFLRDAIVEGEDKEAAQISLFQFLSQLRGREMALAEIEKVIAAGEASPVVLSLRAAFEFEQGNRDLAIGQMQDLLATLEPGSEKDRIKVALAQMLIQTGNSVGARAAVEEILAEDETNVDALKLRAGWMIDDDQVGDAILTLRTALGEAPRDPGIHTLLARAYERDGSQELVGEMLSLAVESSNQAPAESLRYARYLSNLEKFKTAELVLVDALRLVPGNVPILVALGDIYIASEDWPRAEQVVATLRRIDTPLASEQGARLNVRFLQAQQRFADVGVFLSDLVAGGSNAFGAKVAIVRNYLGDNNNSAARSYVAELLTESPDDIRVQFLDAAIDAAGGDFGTAESKYRAILEVDDQLAQVWVALYQAQTIGGKSSAAAATIDKALKVFPDLPTLKWIKAGVLEKSGDVDGAIAIYEVMYAQNSNNLVVANNLASLLSTSREDAETIDRANT
ncbi:MAG: tetratricopeptide repeat protein, partial [Paracoccaceae bacterium]